MAGSSDTLDVDCEHRSVQHIDGLAMSVSLLAPFVHIDRNQSALKTKNTMSFYEWLNFCEECGNTVPAMLLRLSQKTIEQLYL